MERACMIAADLLPAHPKNRERFPAPEPTAPDRLAAALHATHAHLRLHRLHLRPAPVPALQPDPRLAAHRAGGPEDHRPVRADPVSLYLEIPLVALPRSLRRAVARAPARLDAPDPAQPAGH